MSSQYYKATAYVGTPHRNAVEVTIPLVGPQGPAGEAGAGAVESVNGQTGVVVLAAADVGAASTSHTHGNLTNAGAIGTTANLPVKTGTSGVLEAGAFGTAAGQFAEGNDTRIATIASGSITTADGGGSIDTRGTGSIGLGVTGTRTTLTGTATANRALSLPNASGTLALSPAETSYNITATSIGSPQQIDLSASPFTEATEVRSVLNNSTGIVYVQIYLPIDTVSIVPKFRFYHQIGGLGDITYIQLIRENDVVFPASGSGYEELNDGETLEVVWNGTSYGLTPNAPFMRRITLPDASGTIALLETLPAGGSTSIWVPASAWIPKTTAGCGVDSRETTTNDQNFDELLFESATSDEFADALVIMPSNYNNGTITARFYWTAASGSGGVAWGIQGRAFANDDALDTAAGTAQLVTDTLIAADDMHITSATSAVTIGGTPAANTPIQFTIYRDISDAADTLGVDARLLGVEILFN